MDHEHGLACRGGEGLGEGPYRQELEGVKAYIRLGSQEVKLRTLCFGREAQIPTTLGIKASGQELGWGGHPTANLDPQSKS